MVTIILINSYYTILMRIFKRLVYDSKIFYFLIEDGVLKEIAMKIFS